MEANHLLPWGDDAADWGRIVVNNIVLVPGICLLLYGLISEPTRLRRLLGSRPFDLFGKASYVLYLVHAGILDQLLTQYITTSLLLRFIITNIIAIALYKSIELPYLPKAGATPRRGARSKSQLNQQPSNLN